MFFRASHLTVIHDSKLPRRAHGGRRSPQGRRPRSFDGHVEHLEGRALLSFGTGGIVTTAVNGSSQAFAVAIQPADQKILVGGDTGSVEDGSFALARYNTDGSLDSSFGTNGVVLTPFSTKLGNPQINSIAVQPSNGMIVAAGTDYYFDKKALSTQGEFALARYTASGSLDNTFGTGGMVTTSFPVTIGDINVAGIDTVLLQSDGEILAVGAVNEGNSGYGSSVALALYKTTGALDKKFGSSGTVVDTSLNTSTSAPNSSGGTTTVYQYFDPAGGALESDNSILVAGSYVTDTKVTNSSGTTLSWTTNLSDLALVHYLANGTRDLSFGTDGIAILPVTPAGVTTSNAWGSNLVVQPNGAIVEVGIAAGSSGYDDMLVARYNPNGTADTSFGGVGYVLVDLGAGVPYLQGTVALQPNGQIVAAGLVTTSVGPYGAPLTAGFATARLNTDGSLDTSFGTGGVVVTQVLSNDLYSNSVALETINSQTMIVDAGTAQPSGSGDQDFALVRYTPSGTLDAGAPAVTTAALPASASSAATATVSTGIIPDGSIASPSPTSLSIGPVESASAAGMTILEPGLVLQALESEDFLDALLPGGRRR